MRLKVNREENSILLMETQKILEKEIYAKNPKKTLATN